MHKNSDVVTFEKYLKLFSFLKSINMLNHNRFNVNLFNIR